MKLSFGFAKKAAAPKKVAVQEKKEEIKKESVVDVSAGALTLEHPEGIDGPLIIACKNPLRLNERRIKLPGEQAADSSTSADVKPEPIPNGVVKSESSGAEVKKEAKEEPPRLVTTPGLWRPEAVQKKENPTDTVVKDEKKDQVVGDPMDDDAVVAQIRLDMQRAATGEAAVPEAAPILMQNKSFWDRKKQSKGNDKASLKLDMTAAPDATKEQYEKIGVEQFGLALLRGMGYDPKQKGHAKPVEYKKRESLLGLGAKSTLPTEGKMPAGSAGAKMPKAPPGVKGGHLSLKKPSPEASPPKRGSSPAKRAAEPVEEPAKRARVSDTWVSEGLVVRITNERRYPDHYGQKAVVTAVDSATNIRLRTVKDGKSIKEVKETHLETVVSKDCRRVRILKNGGMGKLLEKDTKGGTALVRVKGGDEKTMSLDDICEIDEAYL